MGSSPEASIFPLPLPSSFPLFPFPSAFLLLLSVSFSLSFFLTTLARNGRTMGLVDKTRMGPRAGQQALGGECKGAGPRTLPTRDRGPRANLTLYLKKKAGPWRPNLSPQVPHGFCRTGFSSSERWHSKPPVKLKTPTIKLRTIITNCYPGVNVEK